MSTPVGPTMRYGELTQWLGQYRVSDRVVRRLIAKGVIKRYTLAGEWSYFNKDQIEREVLPLLGIKPNNNNGTN